MLALGMSLAACNDDVETDPEFNDLDCGPGESAQVDDVLVCIIENELLIETGFECGPGLEVYEGSEITICAEAELSPEQLEQVEGFNEPGVDPAPTPNNDLPTALETSPLESVACEDPADDFEEPSLSVDHEGSGVLRVQHRGFEANCCARFRGANAELNDEGLVTIAYDIVEDDPCDCNCFYSFDFTVGQLPSGAYTVGITGTGLEASVEVP